MNLKRMVTAALLTIAASGVVVLLPPDAGAAPAQIDVKSVKIANTHKSVTFTFAYAEAPENLWWGAYLYFDTNPKHKGPEFLADVTNQCGGSGMQIGPAKRYGNSYQLDLDRMGPWQGDCGQGADGRCFKTYTAKHTATGHLARLSIKKKPGCMNPAKVRFSGEFRSNDLSDPASTPAYDSLPGSGGQFTAWVRQGTTRTFKDGPEASGAALPPRHAGERAPA